jgi:hypothetical protein
MPSAEAHVQTSSAGRYLARLCQHAGKMGRPQRHRPRAHGGTGGPPEVLHAECSETEGVIALSWGRCALQADPSGLTLRADAADEESLTRIQDMIAGRLEKFGRRENLSVTWHPAQAKIP